MKTYDASIANISGFITFNALLNTEWLAEAINLFVKGQEGLRSRILTNGKDVFQSFEEYQHIEIPVIDFDSMLSAENFFKTEGRKPFGEGERLYRFYIFTAEGKTGVFPCFSHLVADAWSLNLFCDDVIKYYKQLSSGSDIDLQVLSYLEYAEKEAEYLSSQRYIRDKAYWETRFSDKPNLSYIVPERVESADGKSERFTKILEKDISEQIRNCCSEHNISPAILFEAAVFIYLHGINESCSENIIGIPVLNRTTRREKQIVGMFISTVPLGVKIDENSSVEQLFADISTEHSAIFRHQQYPYSDTLRFLREKHDFTGNLFDVMVSYQNAKINADCEFEYRTKWLHNGFGEIPLAIHIDDRDSSGSFTLNLDYQTAIFLEEHIALLFERLIFIIQQMISDEKALLGSIRIMPDSEYNKVVYEFNDTYSDYPRDKCVHELFAEQAKKNPGKTALIFEDTEFTYRQLDEMSNSLAHYLRERGVKPNDIVPIISKRSWHVIAAMLGILKAGGAYMPVDPTYPKDRIEYMLSEAKSSVALTFGYSESLNISTVDLETFDFYCNPEPIENVSSPEDTCYVIFTSGSTGKPKGGDYIAQ